MLARFIAVVALCACGWLFGRQAAGAENARATGKPQETDPPRSSFLPGQIWLDNNGVAINAHGGGILWHAGRYYWFGEHKVAGRRGNSAQVGVHCYSSDDLYNWRDEGIALEVSEDRTSDIVRGSVIERPKVIRNEKTGKFVMWFHLELRGQGYSAARSGVAVSDAVTGPYQFLGSFRPNAGIWPVNMTDEQKAANITPGDVEDRSEQWKQAAVNGMYCRRDFAGGQMARDQNVFMDDDGKAWHFFASEENNTMHVSLLGEDYLKPAGQYARIFPGRYMEAPAPWKHEGRYYVIASDCTGWAPNAARSAVADHPLGPWRELGNPCRGVNPIDGMGPEKTFGGQSTFVLPVHGRKGAYVAMFDIWHPDNPIDGRYVWLPVQHRDGRVVIEWMDKWDLSFFDSLAK